GHVEVPGCPQICLTDVAVRVGAAGAVRAARDANDREGDGNGRNAPGGEPACRAQDARSQLAEVDTAVEPGTDRGGDEGDNEVAKRLPRFDLEAADRQA